MMKINSLGLYIIKHFEGCSLTSYQDIGGIWTIGYGHTDGAHKGQVITQQQADDMLLNDIAIRCNQIEHTLFAPVSSNQFSAITSFVFNLGIGCLRNSTLLSKINSQDFNGAADEFLKWNHVRGKVIAGLTRRRNAERQLFLTPDGGPIS